MARPPVMLLLAVGLVSLARSAGAQPKPDEAIAEALFQEGKDLLDRGDTAPACRKFEESVRLDPLPGSILNLGLCHEAEGRVASAWSELTQAMSLARADGRKDRQAIAEEHLAALGPRLPKLKLLAPSESRPGLTVFLRGKQLGSAALGAALPLDPGEAIVRVEAPGHTPFEQTLQVTEGALVEVQIPVLSALPAPTAPPLTPVTAKAEPGPAPERGISTWETVGWVTLGISAAVAISGFAVGGYALAEDSAADDVCGPTSCTTQAGVDHSENADRAATAASVLVPVGLGFAVAGTVVGLVARFTPGPAKQASLTFGGFF